MKHFKKNQKVSIISDNENYAKYQNQILTVSHVAKNREEHPGYDEGVSPNYLYDLKTLEGENVPFSLYDYELTEA